MAALGHKKSASAIAQPETGRGIVIPSGYSQVTVEEPELQK